MLNSTVLKNLSRKWSSREDPSVQQNKEFKKNVDAISFEILKFVEDKNQEDINKGEYGCYVGINEIVEHVCELDSAAYRAVKSELYDEVTLADNVLEKELISWFVSQVIKDLVNTKQLLYVYDHQRVRSRIAEMVFYFSTLRQRFPSSKRTDLPSEYQESPHLTQMIKLSAQSRKRPKRSEDLSSVLRKVIQIPKQITLSSSLKKATSEDNLNEALQLFRQMVREYFKSDSVQLSQFQVDGFQTLFTSALSADFVSREKSYIIQSNTGSGKTETFLFPILLYTILTKGKSGTKALLLYPRIDLCNNQLSRLAKYVSVLNNSGKLKPITISIQHSKFDTLSLDCPHCDGHLSYKDNRFVCDKNPEHQIDFIRNKYGAADIIISTPDSMHRRLMDIHGYYQIWNKETCPKFVVFDEAHIYSEQSGIHVSNIVRRLRHKIQSKGVEPIFIASSATIGDAQNFAKQFFSTEEAEIICPKEADLEEIGREYIVFIKAAESKKHIILENGRERFSVATNLATMIQTAFCFYHTMRKYQNKDRIMGFVDSIDIIKRLGDKLCDAERNNQLFKLRIPDEKLGLDGEKRCNGNCPHINCKNMPPHPYLNPCKIYEDGECWWVMEEPDISPMGIQIHKSGNTSDCDAGAKKQKEPMSDDWNLMITTSALEVGFDHPDIIGTFQYMAPMNIPGFVQRVGRGGRSPSDMPISVVVLGSRPQDSFYFHHPTMLTYPSDEKLRITLDPTNKHIRSMHVTSFMYDYISTSSASKDMVTPCYKEMDTKKTREYLRERRENLISEIISAFNIPRDEAVEYYDKFMDYLESCEIELVPGDPDTQYINLVRTNGRTANDICFSLMDKVSDIRMQEMMEGIKND